MRERIYEFVLKQPRRIARVGRLVTRLSALALMVGAIGHASTGLATQSRQQTGGMGLEILYPNLPTWWIPESVLATAAYLIAALVGMWLNVTGRGFHNQLNLPHPH